jgi:hypothetical protein
MLRVLLSDGKIDHQIAVPRGKGELPKSVHVKKNGPVALVMTSARDDVEPEMQTRMFVADADESGKQNMAVVRGFLHGFKGVEEAELECWVNFQRLLELTGPHEVVIPFRKQIADAIGVLVAKHSRVNQLRIRRDVPALVIAIEASAVIHRAQRKRDKGRIVAERADYENAQRAFNSGAAALYDLALPAAVEAAYDAVVAIAIAQEAENPSVTDPAKRKAYNENHSYRVTVDAVRRKLGLASKESANERLRKLSDLGLIEEDESRRGSGRGSPRHYKIKPKAGFAAALVFPHPDDVLWPDPTLDAAPCTPSQPASGNGTGLTGREIVDAARGGGAKLNLWQDGAGFDPDLTFVTDAFVRDELLARIRDNHDAVLAELRKEAGYAAH